MRRATVTVLCILSMVAPAGAQSYPAKPVRLIVPFAPGGGVDFTSRILAQKLSELWGQQAIVDNRPGAGGIIGTETVMKAAPDGYTLLMGSIGSISINPSLYAKLSYSPLRDFAPVTLTGFVPNIVVVHPAVPVKTIAQLVALGKQKPGLLTFGTGGTGTSNHLSGELFGAMAGIKLRHIPYKVGAQATSDLMGGQLDVMFDNLPTSLPHVRAGKLRGLAVTSASRSSAAPELPTVAESGLAGYDVTGWVGVLVPAQTPGEIVTKLHADIAKVLAAPDAKERFLSQGAEAATSTPQEFRAFVRAEIEKWAGVVRKAGITAQ